MTAVETGTEKPNRWRRLWAGYSELTHEVHRGFIAEWTVTIVLLLFATTTLVQAFVIPSASMVATLLIGDHVLVDKLVYAPPGTLFSHWLPYREVRRGDIIVFRYPLDIKEDYVKRAIGVPGDHIRFVNQQLILNGRPVHEPYTIHSSAYPDLYRDNFPTAPPNMPLRPQAAEMLENHVVAGELVVPVNIEGTPLIIYWSFEAPTQDLTNGNIGIDHIIDVVSHFLTKTRWSRTFRLIRGYPLQ